MLNFFVTVTAKEQLTKVQNFKNVKARVDTHWKGKLSQQSTVKHASSAKVKASSSSSSILLNGRKMVRTNPTEMASKRGTKLLNKTDRLAQSKRQNSALPRRKAVVALKKLNPTVQTRFQPPTFDSYSNGLINGCINNIDNVDDEDAHLVSEYVNDIYAYLFELDAIRKNHLSGHVYIKSQWRTVLLNWISDVHTNWHLTQETFHMTVSIIDRYLQTVKSTSEKNLQLVGVAALLIAAKYEERRSPSVQNLVHITDNTYTNAQVVAMERNILKKLKFVVGVPTSVQFLCCFAKVAQANAETCCLSKYFIELATMEYSLSEYLPSEIAAAALHISLAFMEKKLNPEKSFETILNSIWTSTLAFYTTYDAKHLYPIIIKMIAYIKVAPSTKTNNIYTKYATAEHSEIAVICEKKMRVF